MRKSSIIFHPMYLPIGPPTFSFNQRPFLPGLTKRMRRSKTVPSGKPLEPPGTFQAGLVERTVRGETVWVSNKKLDPATGNTLDMWVQTIGKSVETQLFSVVTCSIGNTSSFRIHLLKKHLDHSNSLAKTNSKRSWGIAFPFGARLPDWG